MKKFALLVFGCLVVVALIAVTEPDDVPFAGDELQQTRWIRGLMMESETMYCVHGEKLPVVARIDFSSSEPELRDAAGDYIAYVLPRFLKENTDWNRADTERVRIGVVTLAKHPEHHELTKQIAMNAYSKALNEKNYVRRLEWLDVAKSAAAAIAMAST